MNHLFVSLLILAIPTLVNLATVDYSSNRNGHSENPQSQETAAALPCPEIPETDNDWTRVEQTFGKLPLYFIENQGQVDEEVAFYVKGADKTLYFMKDGVTFALKKERRWACKLAFVGGDPNAGPRGEDKQDTLFSFFKGKSEDWKRGLSSYGRVVYRDLWPGIDLVFSGTVNRLRSVTWHRRKSVKPPNSSRMPPAVKNIRIYYDSLIRAPAPIAACNPSMNCRIMQCLDIEQRPGNTRCWRR